MLPSLLEGTYPIQSKASSHKTNHPRFLVGIAAGIGICLTPIFIAEVSPARIRGKVGQCVSPNHRFRPLLCQVTGVFTQLSIVVGIMVTQLIGFKLSTQTAWRYVLLLSSLTATAQFLLSPTMVESPIWAVRNGDPQSGKAYLQRLWTGGDSHCKRTRPRDELRLNGILQHLNRTHCSSETLRMHENMLSISRTPSRLVSYGCPSQSYLSLWSPNRFLVQYSQSSFEVVQLNLRLCFIGVNAGALSHSILDFPIVANFY
jgi:MFS family permease